MRRRPLASGSLPRDDRPVMSSKSPEQAARREAERCVLTEFRASQLDARRARQEARLRERWAALERWRSEAAAREQDTGGPGNWLRKQDRLVGESDRRAAEQSRWRAEDDAERRLCADEDAAWLAAQMHEALPQRRQGSGAN